jgi:hypothetical protein
VPTQAQHINHDPKTTIDPQLNMTNLLDFVANREQYYPIYEPIISNLEPADVFHASRVSKDMSDVYTESLKTQWNIDTYLKPLFKDVTGFRRVQAQTGTLLANHVARDFFLRDKLGNDERTKWYHLIVQAGEDTRTLISFLQGEGYSHSSKVLNRDRFLTKKALLCTLITQQQLNRFF